MVTATKTANEASAGVLLELEAFNSCRKSAGKCKAAIYEWLSILKSAEHLYGDALTKEDRAAIHNARATASQALRDIMAVKAHFNGKTASPRVHISKGNAKLGSLPSFSTLPGVWVKGKDGTRICNVMGTCHGVCRDCVKDCYAVRSLRIQRPATVRAWAENTTLARSEAGRAAIYKAVKDWCTSKKPPAFRIHMAGEFESRAGVELWADIAASSPNTTFYAYTKRREYLEVPRPSNFSLVFSEWGGNAEDVDAPRFAYDDGHNGAIAALPHCPAVDKNGKRTGTTCDACGLCAALQDGERVAVYKH